MAELPLAGLWVDIARTEVAARRPLLINRDPSPQESQVPINTTIAFEILDPGPDGIGVENTRVWVQGELAFDGPFDAPFQPPFSGPGSSVEQTADTLRITLHPERLFVSLSTVQVRVLSQTQGGEHVLDETYSFVIEDHTSPKLLAAHATSLMEVRAAFDEPVRVTEHTMARLTPQSVPAVTPSVVRLYEEGSVVFLKLNQELSPGVSYELTMEGIFDLYGNVILPPFDRVSMRGFSPPRPSKRQFSLWEMIPRYNRSVDHTGDLRRFIDCLEEVLQLLLFELDQFPRIFDIEQTPTRFLNIILCDLGNPFPFELDTLSKRRLSSTLIEMYQQKGTQLGIRNAIRFFLGIEVEAIVPFTSTTLILGESELGIDWDLGPSDQFALYSFNIRVGRVLTPTERRHIRLLVDVLKPGHTHFIDLIEPTPPPHIDHWEMDVSELGETSLLH